MGMISRLTLISCLIASCLTVLPVAAPAQSDRPPPIQVPRYDDADEFLPTAQARNREGIRLVLPQQPGEILFKVLTPRNVTVDVVARYATSDVAAVILLPGGTGVLSIVNDRLDRSFNFQSRSSLMRLRTGWTERVSLTCAGDRGPITKPI
jgi:hypothetical protein